MNIKRKEILRIVQDIHTMKDDDPERLKKLQIAFVNLSVYTLEQLDELGRRCDRASFGLPL
jgi:hypothetical protein